MKFEIRQANTEDVATIAEFNFRMALETEGRELDRPTLARGVETVLEDASKGVYYVTQAGDQVVGQLLLTYEWSDWRNGNFWWIQSVYVKPEYRRHGIFKSLYKHVEQLARRRADVCGLRLYVEAHNARAQRSYQQLGMKKTAYEMFEVDFVLRG
ncbi:MAG TPA: GNAT family N-acetyltransferase [Acidobacteriota bacterium]|jgi:GNAT superfamily N-acetyltransferase